MSIFSTLFFIGCTSKSIDTSTTDPEPSAQRWQEILVDDSRGAFMSIWEGSEQDVWIVGGQAEAGLVLRCLEEDCPPESWVSLSLPEGTPLLNWVHGTTSTDVWVGGLFGTLLHWDGVQWSDFSIPMEEAIWGIVAVSPDSVVVVGGASRWGGEKGQYFQKTTEGFVSLALPAELESLPNLFKVHYDGQYFWAVGAQGALMRCDLVECTAIPTGRATDLITITSDGSSLHLVGGRGTGIYAPIQNDGLGTVLPIPAGINGISAQGDSILIVGERGFSAFVDPQEQSYAEIPSVTFDVLHAACIGSRGRAYAVGGNLFTAEPSFHGVLLQYPMDVP